MTHQVQNNSENIFLRILNQARENPSQPSLVVFDIDSTLFDVSERHTHIMRDFANSFWLRMRYPSLTRQLRQARAASSDWGYVESLRRLGVRVTDRQAKVLHRFWHRRFFSNHYLVFDRPYEGAVEYVNALLDAGVHIIYLTGRHHNQMHEGTLKSFHHYGLPIHKNAILKLKTETSVPDEDFKLQYLLNIPSSNYEKIWFVENEPVNLNLVEKYAPAIELVYFDSVHSGREVVSSKSHVVNSFPSLTPTQVDQSPKE